MTGNCLKGSRGLVVFDDSWNAQGGQGMTEGEGRGDGEWKGLMKEMLTHVSPQL